MAKKKNVFSSPIVVECAINEHQNKIGVHVLDPSNDELEDALYTAERDNFPAVYVHFSNVLKFSNVKKKAA